MSPHSILAVLTGGASDRAVLDTARKLADPEAAEVTALHVKADPQSVLPFLGDGLSGAMAGEAIAAMERDVRAKAARSSFELRGKPGALRTFFRGDGVIGGSSHM